MKPLTLFCLPLLLAGLSHAANAADSANTQANAADQVAQVASSDNTTNTASNLNDAFCTAGTPCAVVKQRNAGLH